MTKFCNARFILINFLYNPSKIVKIFLIPKITPILGVIFLKLRQYWELYS